MIWRGEAALEQAPLKGIRVLKFVDQSDAITLLNRREPALWFSTFCLGIESIEQAREADDALLSTAGGQGVKSMVQGMAPDPLGWAIPKCCNRLLQAWLGKVWIDFAAVSGRFAETSRMEVVPQ